MSPLPIDGFLEIHDLFSSVILPRVRELQPDQLVCNGHNSARRLPKKKPRPEYVKKFGLSSHFSAVGYVLAGDFIISINNHSYHLRPHDLCVIPPQAIRYDSFLRKDRPYTVLWMDEATIKRTHFHIDTYIPGEGLRFLSRAGARDLGTAHTLLDQLKQLHEAASTPWTAIRDLLTEIFTFYAEKIEDETAIFKRNRLLDRSADEFERWNKIGEYIRDNPDPGLTPSILARSFSYSIGHFEKMFRKYNGESVKEVLIKRKLKQALDLLAGSDLTIDKISESLSFPNPYYFSMLFKKYCGCAPSMYREKYQRRP